MDFSFLWEESSFKCALNIPCETLYSAFPYEAGTSYSSALLLFIFVGLVGSLYKLVQFDREIFRERLILDDVQNN